MKSYHTKLDELGRKALKEAKRKLIGLGGSMLLDKDPKWEYILHIDPCDGIGHLYDFTAHKAVCMHDALYILADVGEDREKELLSPATPSTTPARPDENWVEGGEFYAEWEGLFDIIDYILEA